MDFEDRRLVFGAKEVLLSPGAGRERIDAFREGFDPEVVGNLLESRKRYASRIIALYDPDAAFEEGIKLVELLDGIIALSEVFSLEAEKNRGFVQGAIQKRSQVHPHFVIQVSENSEIELLRRVGY